MKGQVGRETRLMAVGKPTVTQTDIRDGVLSLGIAPGATAMVHSSLSAFGHVQGGADAVIAEGIEAAAHNGFSELPLFSLIPQVADAVSIPVVAAGGIADARGVVAALSLGAEGAQLGTRFVAVDENIAHHAYKQAIIDAQDTDTMITCRKLVPTRCLMTAFSNRLQELENSGASEDEIRQFLGYSRARTGQIEGDLENGEAYCGASAGLIKEILPAGTVVRRLVEEYQRITRNLL